ncbi:peptidoglycan-binding protein [Leadbetterella sp. DM7]|uniref:peptidoglycan-binding protein n=1 Tax=Leadbetterella sp. DM7 TaxID=3235085 RepID=UPI00349F04E4
MKKIHYQRELVLPFSQQRGGQNTKKEVMKIQSWLCLYETSHSGSGTYTSIDGTFGPATERAVKNFQNAVGIPPTGIVDQATFDKMTSSLCNAFEASLSGPDLRSLIAEAAEKHLAESPSELVINGQTNSGPWVRSYMDGHEGTDWLWCMGFVQTIIDQAFSHLGRTFTEMFPLTYSCDVVGMTGLDKGVLVRNPNIRNGSATIKKGDIFLLRQSRLDWIHTGIIVEIEDKTFTTIEGNTNINGSSNGIGVFKRVRNYNTSIIDVFSIEKWV